MMVGISFTEDGMSICEVHLSGISDLMVKCANRIHNRFAGMKGVMQKYKKTLFAANVKATFDRQWS